MPGIHPSPSRSAWTIRTYCLVCLEPLRLKNPGGALGETYSLQALECRIVGDQSYRPTGPHPVWRQAKSLGYLTRLEKAVGFLFPDSYSGIFLFIIPI